MFVRSKQLILTSSSKESKYRLGERYIIAMLLLPMRCSDTISDAVHARDLAAMAGPCWLDDVAKSLGLSRRLGGSGKSSKLS